MPFVTANGIKLYVRQIGNLKGAPVLLLQGLGMQATDWPRSLINVLAATNRVIMFDNRDAGRSQSFGPDVDEGLRADHYPSGAIPQNDASYSLFDMAEDACELMNALGIVSSHLIGFSMGGMIAQIIAARYRQRVRSLVSLMSSGGQAVIRPQPNAAHAMAHSIVATKDQAMWLNDEINWLKIYRGPRHEFEETAARRRLVHNRRRAYRPAGTFRQALAMYSAGDRRPLLSRIVCPTLVIHGGHDPIISLDEAKSLLKLVRGARLQVLPESGHDLNSDNISEITDLIVAHVTCCEAARIKAIS